MISLCSDLKVDKVDKVEVDKSANLLGKVNMIYDLIGCKKWQSETCPWLKQK